MNRRGLFVTGTDTGIGKTKVTAGIAAALSRLSREGRFPVGELQVWKPVQTGVPSAEDRDADSYRLVAEGGLIRQSVRDTATLTYPEPLAPWMAARRAGETIDYASLLAEGRRRMSGGSFLLAEGAGGIAVPLTETKLIAHLAADLGLPALIVARTGLGTVNHTLLTVALARQYGIRVAGVVLNETSAHAAPDRLSIEENAEMIASFGDVPIVGVLPWMKQTDGTASPEWIETVCMEMDWTTLLGE
ncbi:dethiobiotin synthase [Paenibacillus mesophilus]|uniref:dethiobiotin synthase n=1 Tax=Paenibacillus mesophilus TaxID=2582849 RepID=UPI00130506F9|nr:dethiobiotin synthase [Paenibacillus mesophilus]